MWHTSKVTYYRMPLCLSEFFQNMMVAKLEVMVSLWFRILIFDFPPFFVVRLDKYVCSVYQSDVEVSS